MVAVASYGSMIDSDNATLQAPPGRPTARGRLPRGHRLEACGYHLSVERLSRGCSRKRVSALRRQLQYLLSGPAETEARVIQAVRGAWGRRACVVRRAGGGRQMENPAGGGITASRHRRYNVAPTHNLKSMTPTNTHFLYLSIAKRSLTQNVD